MIHLPPLCFHLQINAIESNNLGPGIRLYLTRKIGAPTGRRTRSTWRRRAEDPKPKGPCLLPTIAVRARREKDEQKQRPKRPNFTETYDYATNMLNIDIEHSIESDPFTEPQASSSSAPQSSNTPTRIRKSPFLDPSQPDSSRHGRIFAPPSMPDTHNAHAPRPPSLVETSSGQLLSHTHAHSTGGPKESAAPMSTSTASSYYDMLENMSKEGTKFRSALCARAQALFARQHRIFLFQVIIVNRWARFIRWDRSGALVTARFDYATDPQLLAGFIWRFSHMNGEQRGFDPTARLADGSETRQFKYAVKRFLNDMKMGPKKGKSIRHLPDAERTLDDTDTYPIWKIHVVDAATRKSTDLIVNSPFADHPMLFGRATRAYIAYDVNARRLVFMKDTWRADNSKLRVESRTYQRLRRYGVPHLPNVLYSGDVRRSDRRPQATTTDVYAVDEGDWRTTGEDFDKYVHHRVVQDIAYPVESALDARELMQVVYDVLCGVCICQVSL